MNIFVGNLPFAATETDVKTLFESFGNVASVVIVKDRKGVESRGFGFLEMPDDQQAQAAIGALNNKEFMGRPLNISPVRPKTEEEREAERKSKLAAKMKAKAQALPQENKIQRDAWFSAVYKKTEGYSGYKRGRRTRSYVTRRAAAGIEEPLVLKRKPHDNPMRWRKKKDQARPWKKPEAAGAPRPWKKPETGHSARPWKKPEAAGAPRPWKKPETEQSARPWKKPEAGAKPWRKSNARPQRPRFRGQKKPGGYARPNR
jgi:hypothetical protein